jgi:molecular chaperone DnaK (HSP70)
MVTTFSLDLDGILHVTTREKETGLECSITISNALARMENDQLDAARERVRALFGEEASENAEGSLDAGRRRQNVEALALVEKAERLLEDAGQEDSEDLINGIEAVRDALDQDEEILRMTMGSLADLIYYLEG